MTDIETVIAWLGNSAPVTLSFEHRSAIVSHIRTLKAERDDALTAVAWEKKTSDALRTENARLRAALIEARKHLPTGGELPAFSGSNALIARIDAALNEQEPKL